MCAKENRNSESLWTFLERSKIEEKCVNKELYLECNDGKFIGGYRKYHLGQITKHKKSPMQKHNI